MSAQTSYTKDMRGALAGLIAYVSMPADIVSRIAEAAIGYGLAVGRGTDPAEQALVGLAGGFIGISVRDTAIENQAIGAETQEYPAKKNMAVMREGYIWVKLAATMTPAVDGDVWFNNTTGEFGTTVTAGFSKVDNAKYESAAMNGLALVRIGVAGTTAGA